MRHEQTVAGGYAHAFAVSAGERVTITDLEGQQVIDFIALSAADSREYLSVAQTRSILQRVSVHTGDTLLTNLGTPLAQIEADTVGVHDLTYASCSPALYRAVGAPGHRSCQENFTEVLAPYGIGSWRLPDPFNIFQNTPINPDGTYRVATPPSKAGDYLTMRLLRDALCAVSACPFDLFGFNGGKATPINVRVQD